MTSMTNDSVLTTRMSADPGAVIEDVARECDVTPRAVVEALPATMRRFAAGTHFVDAMMDIAQWGDVTLIINTDDGIMEFTGPIVEGKVMRGYYNVMAKPGFTAISAMNAVPRLLLWSARSWANRPPLLRSSTSKAASCSRCSSAGTKTAS